MVSHLITQVIIYLDSFLGLAALVAVTLRLRSRKVSWRWLSLLCCALVPLVPFKGLTLAEYPGSAFGPLSITTLLLLGCGLWSQLTNRVCLRPRERQTLFIGIAISGLILYPATFGLATFDPYQLGFGSSAFILALLFVTLYSIVTKSIATAIIIIAAAIAFDLHLLESGNLWDYLIDPFITVYVLVVLFALAVTRIVTATNRRPAEI